MSDKEPEGEEVPKPRKKRLKRFVIGVAVFATLLGGSAYFAQDWLIDEMRSLVLTTLKDAGIHVDYSSARQDPVRGAVLGKVSLYETEKQEKLVMTITNLGLSPSLSQWFLEGELSIRVTLKDSDISMLVDGEEVERLENVTSVMKAGASGVTVGHLSAVMNGVDYNVKGRVDFGSGKDKGGNAEKIEETLKDKKKLLLDFSFLKPLGEWLSVDTQKGKLHVISDFNIDAANLDGMIVNSRFSGESFVWHGVAFDLMKAEVVYSGKDKSVNVKSIDAAYRGKSAKGELLYLMPTKTLEITKMDSRVDVLSWIRDYSGKSAEKNGQELLLIQAPHLGLSGSLDFGDLKKSDLKIELLNTADAVVKKGEREMSFKELQGKLTFAEGRVSILDPGISAKVVGGDFNLSGKLEVMGGGQNRSANITVTGKSFPYHGITFDHMKANVIYSGADKIVDVKSFDMAYQGKPVTGEFRYLMPTKTLEITGLDSQVDFLKLIKDYSGKSTEEGGQEVVLVQAPHLGINGRVEFENLEKSDLKIEFLNTADAVVKRAGREMSFKELQGKLTFAGGSVSIFEPGISAKVVGGDFHLSGELEVMGGAQNRSANLTVSGKSFPYHGVTFDHMKANVIYSGADKIVDVKSFDMAYRGKPVTGEFRYLMPTKTLEIAGLESQMDFLKLIQDYSGKSTEEGGQEVVLVQAPHLGINGRVEFENLEKSDLNIEFLNAAGVVVETAGRQISMEELKGKLAFAGGNVSTLEPGLSTKIAGGEVYLSGKMAVMSNEKSYQAALKMENVSVNEVDALINVGSENKELPGRLFFDFDGSGDMTAPVKDARGKVKIEGAKFYAMRHFGSLFTALNTAVPAFGKHNAGEKAGTQELTGTYQVQDEVIRSDDLVFGGELSQIVVKGDYSFQEKLVKLDGKAEFKGVVGLATGLASNLLELSGAGPLNDIKWKLKNLNAVGVVKVGAKGVTETSKEALKLGGDTAKGAAIITGKSVEGISKGLKKVLPFKKEK